MLTKKLKILYTSIISLNWDIEDVLTRQGYINNASLAPRKKSKVEVWFRELTTCNHKKINKKKKKRRRRVVWAKSKSLFKLREEKIVEDDQK